MKVSGKRLWIAVFVILWMVFSLVGCVAIGYAIHDGGSPGEYTGVGFLFAILMLCILAAICYLIDTWKD